MNNVTIKPNWLRIMRQEAARVSQGQRHPLLGVDDLESVGNEAVCEVLGKYDPDADPVRFESTLRMTVRQRMRLEVRRVKGLKLKKAKRTVEMPVDVHGELVPFEDRRTVRPDQDAERRELLAGLPSTAEVRVKALRLRAAVLNALSPEDVTGIIRAQAERAKKGDTKAARLCLQVIGVSVSGVDQSDL